MTPGTSTNHYWKPEKCKTLEYSLVGSTEVPIKNIPNDTRIKETRARFMEDTYKGLRAALKEKGWSGYGLGNDRSSKNKRTKSKWNKDSNDEYPSTTSCVTLDPSDLGIPVESHGLYSTLELRRHPFADSTLIDNCGAMHVVNNRALLDNNSFIASSIDDFAEAGTSRLPITGRGTRTMKNILSSANGPKTKDLTLTDVALIEGFHVNIISEARLAKAGIWYCGADLTLRYGKLNKSVVVASLQRKGNVAFIEFKPTSSYSLVPSSQVLVYPTLERRIPSYRKSRDYLKPRADIASIWHLRAGHLGPEALQRLVHNARNVKIIGIERIKCEHCARAHATQVISRRTSENRSPRPFWRIQWDLFDFPPAYNGAKWLLIIKDEYSGKLFASALMGKRHEHIFPVLFAFEQWIKRKFNLSICIFKHNQEKGVIAINGTTLYERWLQEEGIELELSPSYTHEPVGGSERAGQKTITRSIKMRTSANLPENLWPETAIAGIYLYNMSPSASKGWKSPNEVLEA